MSNFILTPPYQPFTLDKLFKGVFNGYIYAGVVNATAGQVITNQIQAYVEAQDGTLTEIPQPIRTNGGGFPVYNGEVVKVVFKSAFSLLVQDKNQNQVWYEPNMSFFDPQGAFEGFEEVKGEIEKRVPSLTDFGLVGDGITDDTAAMQALEELPHMRYDGNGLKYLVTTLPANYNMFKNACFVLAPLNYEYPTDDWLNLECSKITNTRRYTAWTQEKVFTYKGGIYVPFQQADGHTFPTTEIMWVKSFDGESFSEPELLFRPSENDIASGRGINCFSAGMVGNRVCFIVEFRDENALLLYANLYHRVMYINEKMTNDIQLVNGSSIATITLPDHGLLAGDTVTFSGVQGQGVAGLSGKLTVVGNSTKDTFQVDKGSPSDYTGESGGDGWICGATFYDNNWHRFEMGTFPNPQGNPITHIHSFTCIEGTDTFFAGFHNGSNNPREVGVLKFEGMFSGNITVKKLDIPSTMTTSQAEPSIGYKDGVLYMTTRGQSTVSNGSQFLWSDDDGVTWQAGRFPNVLHYDPLPFVFDGDDIYIFGTERRSGEWDTSDLNQWVQGRTRSFMMKAKLADLKAFDFSKMETTCLGYGWYAGEYTSAANGVGSAVIYDGTLRYYYGGENFSLYSRYSLNYPSVMNEFLDNGYQPDIYEFNVKLVNRYAGQNHIRQKYSGSRNMQVHQFGNEYQVHTPIDWYAAQEFRDNIVVVGRSNFTGATSYASTATFSAEIESTNINTGTNPSEDRSQLHLAGGGAISSSRGAIFTLYGSNHDTFPNDILFGSTTTLAPSSNNVTDIGTADRRVKTGYFVNAIDTTSDRNHKDNIRYTDDIDSKAEWDALLNAVRKVKFSLFEYKDSIKDKGGVYSDELIAGARTHAGFVAQDLIEAMKSEGLDPFKYAVLRYSKWNAKDATYTDHEPAIYDKEGNLIKPEILPELISPAVEAGERYSVVMDEFIILKLAAAGL